jgi:hypothetical protein
MKKKLGRRRPLQLSEAQTRTLYWKHRIFSREACDGCGCVLGLIKFALANKSEVFCSRKCRDAAATDDPGGICKNCGALLRLKGRASTSIFCGDPCAKQFMRFSRKLRVRKNSKVEARA